MTLRLDIQPGGEKYLSFAKLKLKQMKEWMRKGNLRMFTRHFWISDTDRILVSALDAGYGLWLDRIRIEAGGVWDFFITANGVQYFGLLDKAVSGEIPTALNASRVISTLGKVRALSRDTSASPQQWKVVDNNRAVVRLREGAFDSYTTVRQISANPESLGLVLVGSDIRLLDETIDMIVPARADHSVERLFPLLDSFMYGRWGWSFGGGGPATEFFDLATGAVAPGGLADTGVNPVPLSTYHDVLFMSWPAALDTASVWSAKNGLLDTWARSGTEHPEAFGFLHPVASSSTNYYSFEIEKLDGDTVTIGVISVLGTLSLEGELSYSVQRSTAVIASWTFTKALTAAVATQSKAYSAFFPSSGVLQIIDDAGAVSVLDLSYPGNLGFLSAGTKEHAWWVAEVPSGGATTVRFYNETGLVLTTAAFPGTSATNFALAGTTAEHVFIRMVLGGVERVIGSDGTVLVASDVLPSWVTPSASSSHLSKTDKLYTLFKGTGDDPADSPDLGTIDTLHHITSNVGSPPALEAFRYSVPAGLASVSIPVRSTIQTLQEHEDWVI